jgi:hypothetical protein
VRAEHFAAKAFHDADVPGAQHDVVDSAKLQHFRYRFCTNCADARTPLAWLPHVPLATPRKESTDMATASQNIQDVQQSAKEKLAREKDRAADTVGNLAGALREAVRGPGGSDERAAHMAEWAADGLESVSATLRSNDLNAMMRQAESFARSQPVAFFFAAAAAGFLASRFLKAGGSSSNLPDNLPE